MKCCAKINQNGRLWIILPYNIWLDFKWITDLNVNIFTCWIKVYSTIDIQLKFLSFIIISLRNMETKISQFQPPNSRQLGQRNFRKPEYIHVDICWTWSRNQFYDRPARFCAFWNFFDPLHHIFKMAALFTIVWAIIQQECKLAVARSRSRLTFRPRD